MTEPVIFEQDGGFFYRCPECASTFEGKFATETDARTALYSHRLRVHA